MQGDRVSGRVATWVSGVVGVWAGLAALGVIVAALISPNWALLREPIVLTEAPRRLGLYSANDPWALDDHNGEGGAPAVSQPTIVTTVTFRVGLWAACPYINNSHSHTPVVSPPCTVLAYTWDHITHRHLHLPSPAPLAQTVIARMRLSTPFLVVACIFLTVGCLLAVVVRCCYSHAALLAALLFSLAGLSVGAGVVWFVSVVSEEYGAAYGRRTSWSTLYAYRYGWALLAAGAGGVCALLAALLTGHAYLARHGPLMGLGGPGGGSGILGRSVSGTEESLARPLLRCRSEGCLGQRSFTSDTIRTYLTCDSRRHLPRACPAGIASGAAPLTPHAASVLPHSTSIDTSRDSSIHQSGADSLRPSRRSSRATILGDDLPQDKTKPQEWDTSRVIIETQRLSCTSSSVMVVPPPPPLSSSSSSPSPMEPPPPLLPPPLPTPVSLPPSTSAAPIRSPLSGNTSSSTASSSSSSSSRAHVPAELVGGGEAQRGVSTLPRGGASMAHEPLRLPEYNSFTTGDYSRTLPSLGRQMAVFGRRGGGAGAGGGLPHGRDAASLSRSSSKISSEV
ncbi:hypothetical protein C7M84_014760 [Penaeus vannamei]|uniref:Uncharacterized protein n=1 Tax=Penaeus vannamei TaxID=6689 RepID=A0A423SSI4_PENVA|nr:hypothetical protein C7M84_014760 [Penaeus vannamei]